MANIDDKKIPKGTTETPIVGRLHDVSEDHVVTGANEVFDDAFSERQSQINVKLRHYTKTAHIRIDAEEITREHNDNLLNEEINAKQLEIGAVETDIEPILESPNMLPSGAVAFNLGWYRGNDNPEWVYCITDGAKRIAAGIKADGSIEWKKGVPTPVKKYVDDNVLELIERLTEETERLWDRVVEELDKKVDKEEGKSLINKEYADGVSYTVSPDFVEIKIGADNKILEGIEVNGMKYFPNGINIRGVKCKTIDNIEYSKVYLTENNKVIFGIKTDGTVVWGKGVPAPIIKKIESVVLDLEEMYGTLIDNTEWLRIYISQDKKILLGIKADGSIEWSKGVPSPVRQYVDNVGYTIDNPEYLRVILDEAGHVAIGIKSNGDVVFGKGIPTQIKNAIRSAARPIIVSKNGNGDYSSLSKAILDNMGIWGVTLYVQDGVYDLLQELEDYYGTSDFLARTPRGRGLELGYDITIKASPNVVVKADYIGNSEDMQKLFSPFNIEMSNNSGGATLIGVNIKCSRVRYCVHDEKGWSNGTYINTYDNCNFYIDNTDNDFWHSSQCIGGGLGQSGCIIIRNSIFESVDSHYTGNDTPAVSYHNCELAGAQSQLSLVNNYIKGHRGFRFGWHGSSTKITEIVLSGNNVGQATVFRNETSGDSIVNMKLYEWNNVIR